MTQQDSITRSVDIDAPVARVWQALTDHIAFGKWFHVVLDGPFVPGEYTTGRVTYPGYEHLPFELFVERLDTEKTLVWRWQPGTELFDHDDPKRIETTVTFTLEPIPSGTRLTITEAGFNALPPDRYAEAFRLNNQGWDEQVNNVKTYAEA